MRPSFALALLAAAALFGIAQAADPGPVVRTDSGAVEGMTLDGGVRAFKAMPYAAPPIGPLRWKPPAPAPHWAGVRPASADGPACLQVVNADGRPNGGGYAGPVSEDCLTLNVWTPARAAHAPVLVWIFGGGDVAGADSIAPNDGRFFARDGVVVVAMNYRLGALGFFAHPALTAEAPTGAPLADYGLMDQIAALKWVKRNIAAFGGDPANVTISGESAGGENVLALMTAPAARGLFAKATVQSGGGWGETQTLADAERAGVEIAAKAGAPEGATAAELRALSAEKFIGAGRGVGVIVDGRLMPQAPPAAFAAGRQAPVPLIIGSNTWEASLLPASGYAAYLAAAKPGLRAAYADEAADPARQAQDMFTDAVMGAPARWYAARASAKALAWLYEFSYVRVVRRGKIPGANHTSENPYVFDTQMIVPNYSAEIMPQDRAVAAFMHSCWVGFIKSGHPGCRADDGRVWPAFTPETDELMDFGPSSVLRQHYRKPQLDAAEQALGPRS